MAKTKWYQEMTVYQIWIRSFCDGNGDGIGDLWGVLRKLEYIRSLGVDAIWFSPIYPSPNADFGYDISDYKDIHPDYGNLDVFKEVLDRAHEMGMRVFMDLVVNHTSDEHPWFQESRKSHGNPYHQYYIWRHGRVSRGRRLPPNNWTSMFEGGAWEYDENLGEYYLHLFAKKQPDLNMANPAVREEVKQIMRFWLDMGVDGFREDVITYIGKAPGLPDSYPKIPIANGIRYYSNQPEAHQYLKEFKRDVLDHYDCFTVGESPMTTADIALQYVAEGPEKVLDEMIAFSHMEADCFMTDMIQTPFDLRKMKRAFSEWQEKLQGKAWNALYIENHDHPRIISRYGSEQYREESGKMLAAMYMLQRGTPFIYQGQEIGMTNIRLKSLDEFQDVMTHNGIRLAEHILPKTVILKMANKASRENARTPVQWSAEENAGFTTGTPWFPVNENYIEVNVAAQEADPNSLLHFYRELIAFRKANPVALYGDYHEYLKNDRQFYVYERNYLNRKLLVICFFATDQRRFEAPVGISLEKGRLVLSNYELNQIVANGFTARPYELRVYLFGPEQPKNPYEGLRK
ncbi:MAG: alpha-glucosidase [Oscillospiraceae bacterium]|nr:alpha-glucosidase [Oscillospiraceae bacterium]